jgi:PIN domain nuclease of toxin-antitoxin system
MQVLLDTHALIWWFEGAKELSRQASSVIESKENLIRVSAAVGWELAIKTNLGKFNTPALIQDLSDLVEREGFEELPISLDQAIRAGLLPLHHKDPFDRLLVAQAQELKAPIVSADRALDAYDVRRLW